MVLTGRKERFFRPHVKIGLRSQLGLSKNVCNSVASASKNFLVFATPLQVPRKTFWCLQHRCKCLEKLFGVCNTVASVSKNFLAFATLLQVSRKTFWSLQERCKCHEKLFGVCRNAAKCHEKLFGLCRNAANAKS